MNDRTIKNAHAEADRYKSDDGKYPDKIHNLVSKYFKEIPKSPSGNGYSIDEQGKVLKIPGLDKRTC